MVGVTVMFDIIENLNFPEGEFQKKAKVLNTKLNLKNKLITF